jgi:hypothetical protein
VEVKIGVQSIPREITVETTDSVEEVEAALRAATDSGTLFVLRNGNGGTVMVPGDKIGYVELIGVEQRRVGFGQYT